MAKVVVFDRPANVETKIPAGFAVVRLVPWARMVKAITQGEKRIAYDPPLPLERCIRKAGVPDDAGAESLALSAKDMAEIERVMQVEWAETEIEFAHRAAQKAVPKGIIYTALDEDKIPAYESDYRNAWELNAAKTHVEYNIPKTQELHKERLRALRAPKLDELDRQYNRAVGQKKSKEADEIERKRQALRDVTDDPAIGKAKSVSELSSAVPAILMGGE